MDLKSVRVPCRDESKGNRDRRERTSGRMKELNLKKRSSSLKPEASELRFQSFLDKRTPHKGFGWQEQG